MIFFVPGFNETLRVNGTAAILQDPGLCAEFTVNGKPALSVMRVTVRGVRLTLSAAGSQRTVPAAVPVVLAPSESRLLWVDLDLGLSASEALHERDWERFRQRWYQEVALHLEGGNSPPAFQAVFAGP
jgi:predicted pyridoxine 5'-phosphate oxidase superfamily flavin-nucleotide-binding protein